MSQSKTKLEFSVEQHLCKRIKKLGGQCIKLPASLYTGIPDRMVLLPEGRIIFTELKRPKNGVLALVQKRWQRVIKNLGFECYVLKNNDEVDEVLDNRKG